MRLDSRYFHSIVKAGSTVRAPAAWFSSLHILERSTAAARHWAGVLWFGCLKLSGWFFSFYIVSSDVVLFSAGRSTAEKYKKGKNIDSTILTGRGHSNMIRRRSGSLTCGTLMIRSDHVYNSNYGVHGTGAKVRV